jgi:hypothetical protein
MDEDTDTRAAPAVWPTCSDLASRLGMSLTTFVRLRAVRGATRTKIGKEVKLLPTDAVQILISRGLPASAAADEVRQIVSERQSRLPMLRRRNTPPPSSPSGESATQCPPLRPTSAKDWNAARLIPHSVHETDTRDSLERVSDWRFSPYNGIVQPLDDLDADLAGRVPDLESFIYPSH